MSEAARSDAGRATRALVIDNRDSFVFNLVEEFRRRSAVVSTLRSGIDLDTLQEHVVRFDPDLVVLSPGPGRPQEAGVMVPWLRTGPSIPVLGICLGHQALVVAAGGRVERAPELVHGRASPIRLLPDPLFQGISTPFVAGRYHSLVAVEVPETLKVIATTSMGGVELIMGVRHRYRCQVGLQFHPESVLTPQGGRLISRFVEEARSRRGSSAPIHTREGP